MSHTSEEDDGVPKFKKDFLKFHNENGVRSLIGSIGPVKNGKYNIKSAVIMNLIDLETCSANASEERL